MNGRPDTGQVLHILLCVLIGWQQVFVWCGPQGTTCYTTLACLVMCFTAHTSFFSLGLPLYGIFMLLSTEHNMTHNVPHRCAWQHISYHILFFDVEAAEDNIMAEIEESAWLSEGRYMVLAMLTNKVRIINKLSKRRS